MGENRKIEVKIDKYSETLKNWNKGLAEKKTGFDRDDIFNRKGIAVKLKENIELSNECKVIAIDSSWGSGKTTFINNFIDYLGKVDKQSICIKFDAWENDFYADPIIPLVGVLESELELNNAGMDDVMTALRVITFEIVKSLTCATIDISKINQEIMDSSRKDLYTYKSLKNEKELIINKLGKLSETNRVYFFVDELDRCKPTFAIQLLERVKHFLGIPKFVFVFGVDLKQLGESARSIYGNINSHAYFEKFFDISINLPKPETIVYFNGLCAFSYKELFENKFIGVMNIFVESTNSITLRSCEKIFKLILICNRSAKKIDKYEKFVPILILLKVLEPGFYKDFINGTAKVDLELLKKYNLRKAYSIDSEAEYTPVVERIIMGLDIDDYYERVSYFEKKGIDNYKPWYSLREYANQLLEYCSN